MSNQVTENELNIPFNPFAETPVKAADPPASQPSARERQQTATERRREAAEAKRARLAEASARRHEEAKRKRTARAAASSSRSTRPRVGSARSGVTSSSRSTTSTRTGTRSTSARSNRPGASSTATTRTRTRTRAITRDRKPTTGTSTTRTRVRKASGDPSGSSSRPSKRPGWDVKGRLQDLEEFTNKLEGKLHGSNSRVEELERLVSQKETALERASESKERIEVDLRAQEEEMRKLRDGTHELRRALDEQRDAHRREIDENERRFKSLQCDYDNTATKLKIEEEKTDRLRAESNRLSLEKSQLQTEIRGLEATVAAHVADIEGKGCTIADLQTRLAEAEELISELKEKTQAHEMLRRKLHNTIQELKGNIRVFCRVRPRLGEEKTQDGCPFSYPDEKLDSKCIEVTGAATESATGKRRAGKTHQFEFDKVFGPRSTQAQVFHEMSQLVQSALDGYNTSIFTYGQTGSGKTYTMEGPSMDEIGVIDEDLEARGMIPRTVEQIFSTADELKEQGWSYRFTASYLEIYNESIRDLLVSKSTAGEKEYKIKHDRAGNTTVTNLTLVPVKHPRNIFDILKVAAKNRSVGSTKANERSSRSHSVFQLQLDGRNSVTGKRAVGILSLIDLAGSERLNVSGAKGDRLTETKNINRSLACLGDVIHALGSRDKGAHIPYRNSKLTFLLQNSLGGNSKTLMLVNISPLTRDYSESMSSLRFATKVNAVDIGTALRNH